MKRVILAGLLCLAVFAQEREMDDRAAQREEWFYGQRAFPLTQIPTGARIRAISEIQRIDRAARSRHQSASTRNAGVPLATGLDATTWTSIGPKPTDPGSTYVTAGRVNAIAVDPRDNNVVYMGAAEGGVWKTTDGGATWTPLTDDQPSLANGAIAIDPSNPDTVYVGTGEENFAYDSYYGAGILKSTDGGATWTNIVGPFLNAKIGALAIHPSNSQILLCSSSVGVYRSTDGAATWRQVLQGIGTSVVFDPTNGNIAYAAIGNVIGNVSLQTGPLNGVYRSTDGGVTWRPIMGSGANSLPASNVGRIALALSPSTPTTLYAAIQDSSTANFGDLLGIFKTTDSGNTWNNLNAPDMCASVRQCWYDMTIQVHPSNPDVVFAAGSLTIMRTMDGGANWTSLSFNGPNRVQLHVDEHTLVFTPDGSKLYIGNDGGIYSTADVTNQPVNWTELNDTIAITEFSPGLSIHPSNLSIGFGGTQDNGTQRFSGSPGWSNVTCGDGGFTAIDSAISSIIFGACQNIAIRRSVNGGANWVGSQFGIASDASQFIAPMVIDPSNPQTLYFGTYRLWQSRDSAGKWSPASADLTSGKSVSTAIAVAPSDSNTVYLGFTKGRIFVTNDVLDGKNASWTERDIGLPTRTITHVAVDPIDPSTAYVTFSGFNTSATTPGHIFRTKDSGTTWTDISGNLPDLPVNDLVIDPDMPDTIYIGTDAGVLVTTDAGGTWSSLGSGMPRVVVESLVLHRKSRTLRAATHGRSMWDLQLPSATSSQPVISALSPSTANAGDAAFSLIATGVNFSSGTVLRWNGLSRPTNVVDGTHLVAQITAADIGVVGRNTVDVFNPSLGGGASNAMPFNIGPAPATASAAFVSAANPLGGHALAPGSIGSLYGTNLAGVTSIADAAPPLPFTLSGTSMSIANVAVPLFFVSPGQVNFQVPWFITNGPVQLPLTISVGQLNTSINATITPFAPALFTTNSQGSGQASVLIAGTASIAAPQGVFPNSRPAAKGEFISIYCTGLGNVTRTPSAGSPSPTNPLAQTIATPSISLGGVPATNVTFSGLAPGFVGLYQVNVQIPFTAASGPDVTISLTIGGISSNTATIAIE